MLDHIEIFPRTRSLGRLAHGLRLKTGFAEIRIGLNHVPTLPVQGQFRPGSIGVLRDETLLLVWMSGPELAESPTPLARLPLATTRATWTSV